MASGCKYFDEDAVYRINKRGFIDFGLVLENSEFVSSDEEDTDDGNLPEWERMKRGHVRVAWHPKGQEEILLERKVTLYDRSLMPGDVVRQVVKGKDTQLGYCRNTDVKATVQVYGTKQVVSNVNSKDLIPLEKLSVDVAVFLDSWIGMVRMLKSEVTLRCSDGSRCVISDDDALDLEDILDKRDRASEFKKFIYYPGQQLWGPALCFNSARWLNLNKEMQKLLTRPSRSVRVTVEDVKIVSLGVQWFCRAYCEGGSATAETEQPLYLVKGDDLERIKMMNIFEPCAQQIGDRNFYFIKETDRILSLEEWKNEIIAHLNPDKVTECPEILHMKHSGQDVNENKENLIDIVCTDEQNDIHDNDSEFEDIDDDEGNTSDSASVTSQSTASSIDKSRSNKHKSKKGPSLATKMLRKKKLKRARRNLLREVLPLKPGDRVVTEILLTETKAHVVWQDGSVEKDIPSSSLYPIHHLDGYEFFPGDFVIENKDNPKPYEYGVIKRVDHIGRTALVTWMKTYLAGSDPHPETITDQEVSVYDIKDHPDFKYRPASCVIRVANFEDHDPSSTAGQVVDVHPSGKVEVYWLSGKTSLCYPQELYRVGENESDDLWGEDDSLGDDDSWETESEGSVVDPEESNAIEEKDHDESKSKEQVKELEKSKEKEEKNTNTEENKSIQEKLLANIEKLRAGMARLEEVFTQNPTLQTCNVMRRLLELYKHCKVLDQLLGTAYFHERHLQSLVERLRQRGRVNSVQHMADQISRLFSIGVGDISAETETNSKSNSDDMKNCVVSGDDLINVSSIEELGLNRTDDSKLGNSVSASNEVNKDNTEAFQEVTARSPGAVTSPTGPPSGYLEPRNVCQQLCAILKTRLLKAHEDVEHRFGMSANSVNSALLAAENDSPPKENIEESSQNDLSTLEASKVSTVLPGEDDVFEKEKELDLPDSAGQGEFSILESVPDSHKYKLSILQPTDPRAFFRTVKKEIQVLRTSLPDGIVVKGFEDRMDLYSVLIKGPKRTPYEDGLFLFDFELPADYPKIPPLCHYISYCSDKLNPNLYESGKVCVSLLGTWGGKGTEIWSPSTSNLLQIIVSIQGLILVAEPYFNEAGYEHQRGTQQGRENSRTYNEMVLLKLVQAMSKMIVSTPEVFKDEIMEHFRNHAAKLVSRLERWLEISEAWNSTHPATPTSPTVFKELHNTYCTSPQGVPLPEFPLLPASKGFCLTLQKSLVSFRELLSSANIPLS